MASNAANPKYLTMFYRKLNLICNWCASITIVITATLFTLFFNESAWQVFLIVTSCLLLVPVILAIDWVILRWQCSPIIRLQREVDQVTGPESGAREALVRVLNLPALTIFRVMCIHGPLCLAVSNVTTLLILNPFFGGEFKIGQLIVLWSTMFITVPAHAIIEYFMVQRAALAVIPSIRGAYKGTAAELYPSLIRISIRRKLLFCSIFTTIVPLGVLGLTTLIKINYSADLQLSNINNINIIIWICVLVSFGACLSVSISILMTDDFARPVEGLLEAMSKVESGDLDTSLEVVSSDSFARLYEGFNRMVCSLKEKAFFKEALGKYLGECVSPILDGEVSGEKLQLGGTSVHASVLFVDIRDFTTLSEGMTPMEVVELLNSYYQSVEPAILSEGGWINKFGGDSLLALFGVPVPLSDHAQRAVMAALRMRAALKQFNLRRKHKGDQPIRIGIGVQCGWLVAGNVGSSNRMEYTVIGDAANTASRLQSLTKEVDTDMLIGAEVYQALPAGMRVQEHLVNVRGKDIPLKAYMIDPDQPISSV
jgi:class 3 adenylate cyclase/HAMP domain-containing protein